jgi:DNA-binding response OmpR family regulator
MKKILVIDDDVKITRPLVMDLKATYGFDVVWLDTAYDVFKTLKGSTFNAVILDIMMPVPEDWSFDEQRRSEKGLSTGLIIHEKIRNEYPNLPIIIYSAKKVSIKDHLTKFLSKPEFPEIIVENLEKLMSHGK